MLRNLLAVFGGFLAGSALNMGLIQLNMRRLFPVPAGMDMNGPGQFNAFIATVPRAAFFVVLAEWSNVGAPPWRPDDIRSSPGERPVCCCPSGGGGCASSHSTPYVAWALLLSMAAALRPSMRR